ncbi:Mammalian cell entry related domain protein [Mycobacteroides abscessus]|uniref:Mammalian cell entry related domain protein n=1 Tax=Mycobacteroides abscessus TaxID=36809 RepID=UPI000DD87C6E|nr:Mammalian cell entry related domain protein [Mycobacteroides abscessus]
MSEESEARTMAVVGLCVLSCVAAITAWIVIDPFARPKSNILGITIESPYVGEGVQPGTALLLHGVAVGEITHVVSVQGGGVRMRADVQRGPTAGLTDTMSIDFRPANYFGVTGISLSPGEGGRALADGLSIKAIPAGNFTLQALLARLGEISHGVLTPKLIDVIDRTTTYLDGVDPLLETMLTVADSLAKVQKVGTTQLLTNATGISVAFPGFVDGAVSTGDQYLHGGLDGATEDYYRNIYSTTIDLASTDLFGAAGKLLGSHGEELAPLTNMIKLLTDVAPGVIPSAEIAYTADELRTRLEKLYSGPPDRRAVNVRVILDGLPGVAAPMAAFGVVPEGVSPAVQQQGAER